MTSHILQLQCSLILSAIVWPAASPPTQLPCTISRAGAPCGCLSFSASQMAQPSSDDPSGGPADTTADEDSAYYYIGDMAFRKSRPASDEAAQSGALNLRFWPGGIIFYLIDEAFSPDYREKIVSAMTQIQSSVGDRHLEFREARSTGGTICRTSYLYVVKTEKEQCLAEVGMQVTGLTKVWLNQRACQPGTIQHELLHSLGRYHEQCRSDRDSHVILMPQEVISTECQNYAMIKPDPLDPSNLVPYDTFSIMHYGSCYFNCRGNNTMLRKDGSVIVPNREFLTALDVAKARSMYPADSKVPYSDSFCQSSGQRLLYPVSGMVLLCTVLAIAAVLIC